MNPHPRSSFPSQVAAPPVRLVGRQTCLHILQAALAAQSYRFACQAALDWLAVFPGDLSVALLYARALLGEGRTAQALPVLSGLCTADPEFLEAVQELRTAASPAMQGVAATHLFALAGSPAGQRLEPWGLPLWEARQALAQDDLDRAEALIRLALDVPAPVPLAGVTHLQFLQRSAFLRRGALASPAVRLALAERYHQLWPDCLACSLFLAGWLAQDGDASRAVALLHQAASRDVGGLVARRLWGPQHPYLPLWPERLEAPLKLAVPAGVAARLGWNRLPAGSAPAQPPAPASLHQPPPGSAGPQPGTLTPQLTTLLREEELPEWLLRVAQAVPAPAALPAPAASTPPASPEPLIPPKYSAPPAPSIPLSTAPHSEPSQHLPDGCGPRAAAAVERPSSPELRPFRQELQRLAARLRLPGQQRLDGRYPVYVIFSLRQRLEAVYGAQLAAILEAEMRCLAQSIQAYPAWGARLYFPDDPASAAALGLQPLLSGKPGALKAALVALDDALARRGEMIGALLIVGGPEIVPFHRLPNPLDDQDEDVPSDCPYANREMSACASAALLPEWPVGRLPGGSGQDARLLLSVLRRTSAHHAAVRRAAPPRGFSPVLWARRWLDSLLGWLRGGKSLFARTRRRASFGYTAAVWRQAAASVFQAIGEPHRLHVSPPLGVDAACVPPNCAPAPLGRLAYFNLHGLVDAPEWYGQRHPLEPEDGPDYPVALRPQDVEAAGAGSGLPLVVFSEACYGLHILDKTSDQALALKFLETGSLAVIGSTCMAYGSLGQPLAAADLLAHAFWRFLKQGLPVGEALRQARLFLVEDMHARQGYLDVEDQKTLLSFALLGDPLALPEHARGASPPRVARLAGPLPLLRPEVIHTACQGCASASPPAPASLSVPEAILRSVEQVVAHSLPEMAQARLAYTCQPRLCRRPGAAAAGKSAASSAAPHSFVTLSKHIPGPHGQHPHYARLTLDDHGKLVKLVVSR